MRTGLLTIAAGAIVAGATLCAPTTSVSAAGLAGAGPSPMISSDTKVTPVHGWHRRCRWGIAGLHRHGPYGAWIPCVPGPYMGGRGY